MFSVVKREGVKNSYMYMSPKLQPPSWDTKKSRTFIYIYLMYMFSFII